jgi:hypothetical protein
VLEKVTRQKRSASGRNKCARDPALNFSNAIDGRYAHRRNFLNETVKLYLN